MISAAHPPDREQHAIALAKNTAMRWLGRGALVDNDDIFGAALLGAAKALDRFDPARGVQFTTFAITLIRAEIQEELRAWDHLSRKMREKASREKQVTGEWPAWSAPPLRLNETIPQADGDELGYTEIEFQEALMERGADPEMLALAHLTREEWQRILDLLPAQERRLIEWRYYEDGEMIELMPEFGCCSSRVYQINRQVHDRLRRWIEEGVVALP